MATASLVVKISADINDFSKKLNAMTKDVTKAANSIADVGKTLTFGITVPAALAALAVGKLGMENEAIANRMRRQFGPAVDDVNERLMTLMKVLPVTNSELSNMSMAVNNMMTGMGMAANKSATLSTALIQMAGDLAATTGKSIPEAMDALEQAMQGRTRGLKQFGVSIAEAQVTQEAYRLGILGVNRELTPLGKSLATYSLLLKQSGTWQGQSTERLKDAEYQFMMLKTEAIEMAEAIGNTLVPMFRVFIGMARALVDTIRNTPPWIVKTAAVLLGLAAAIGPVLFVSAKLVAAFNLMRVAIMLLMGPGALAGLLAMLANPLVLTAIVAIGVALGGVMYLWSKYKKTAEDAVVPPELPKMPSVADLMGGATDEATGDPLQRWRQHVTLVKTELERAVRVGDRWVDSYDALASVQDEAYAGMMRNIGATNEWGQAYTEVYDEVTAIINQLKIMEAMRLNAPNVKSLVSAASKYGTSDVAIGNQIAGDAIQTETQLRLRERTLQLTSAFDGARMATLELGEEQRQVMENLALAKNKFTQSWSNLKDSARTAGATFMTSLMAAFGPVALLLKALGAVLDGLMPFIDALLTPLAELGRVVGIMLTPILKILFIPLKWLTITVAFLGEVLARVSAGISTAVGHLIRALGKFINFIVPFGNPGNALVKAGNAMLDFAKEQYKTADELKKARQEIQRLKYGETGDALDGLADSANTAAEALLNVPTGFKIALERFRAQLPGERPSGTPDVPPPSAPSATPPRTAVPRSAIPPSHIEEALPLIINVDGQMLAKVLVRNLQETAGRNFGNTSRWAEVQY